MSGLPGGGVLLTGSPLLPRARPAEGKNKNDNNGQDKAARVVKEAIGGVNQRGGNPVREKQVPTGGSSMSAGGLSKPAVKGSVTRPDKKKTTPKPGYGIGQHQARAGKHRLPIPRAKFSSLTMNPLTGAETEEKQSGPFGNTLTDHVRNINKKRLYARTPTQGGSSGVEVSQGSDDTLIDFLRDIEEKKLSALTRAQGGSSGVEVSPEFAYNGPVLSTEPRNFAPRSVPATATQMSPPVFALVPANNRPSPLPDLAFTRRGQSSGPRGQSSALRDFEKEVGMDQALVLPTPYGSGAGTTDGPVPQPIQSLRSEKLNWLTRGPTGRPTYGQAMHPDFFPFHAGVDQSGPMIYGVVKIKNIPFDTKQAEIIAFVGRNGKMLNDYMEPVHIIMERQTSKTNDAYVEFSTMHDAVMFVEKHIGQTQAGHHMGRMNNRQVEVELSSQAALMADLFSQTKGVFWSGSTPQILPIRPSEPWNAFKGFVSVEEMTLLVKHVEIPHRSPFARDCPQRPFESMISTLKKMPWHMAHLITIHQRHAIFKAVCDLVRLLQREIGQGRFPEVLNKQLLRRLVNAAMLCPGFSVLQKDTVAYMFGMPEEEMREFCQPLFAESWRHCYVTAPKPGYPLDLLEWYIAIIREETNSTAMRGPICMRRRLEKQGNQTDNYWGFFWSEVAFPAGDDFDKLTLREAADRELNAIERILHRALAH